MFSGIGSPRLGPGGFRLILALLVVLSHLSAFGLGRPAVMLFFMLSGYWVPRMYQLQYRFTTPVWIFYVSRLLRVWLPFVAAFLTNFILHQFLGEPQPADVLWGLGLLGLASTHKDLVGTAWSLDIEIQFYLLVPVLWTTLEYSARKGTIGRMLWVLAVLTTIGWYLQIAHGLWTVLSYLPPFVIGMLIWLKKPQVSATNAIASLAIFMFSGILVLLIPYLRPFLISRIPAPFELDWFGMAWVMLLIPFVIWNLQQKSSARDMHLGNFSFALYVTHWPVIAFLKLFVGPLDFQEKLVALIVIAMVAVAFYVGVDRPSEHLRRKLIAHWSGKPSRNRPVAVSTAL